MNVTAYTVKTTEFNTIEVESSAGLNLKTTDCIEWLLESLYTSFPVDNTLRVFWDLDSSVAPILKLLGEKRCRKLYETNKCYYAPFSLFYILGKVFSIRHVSHKDTANFYDLKQFFPDSEAIENPDHIASAGEMLLSALREMGLRPTKLTSPVAIYEECVLNHLNLPTAWDMPVEAAEFAYNCGGKLWIEAYQIGYFEKAFDYDIVAAFPSVARDLIDIRHCDWVQSQGYVSEAFYGYCRCEVTINDDVRVSPIIHIDEEGNSSTPVGTRDTFILKEELDFISKWGIGDWSIYDGWWAVPGREVKPLEIAMNRLLAYRDNENELIRMLAKRQSVGIYGKFGEEWQTKFAPHFNPVWFSEISTRIRLKVASFIYENKLQDHLIHVGVDGVLLDREVEL